MNQRKHVLDMDEFTADAFVNRDEPIPTIKISGNDNGEASEPPKGKRERLKESATSKLKEKAQDVASPENKRYGYSIQDRLFTK